MVFGFDPLDMQTDSRNDGYAYRITRHFVEVTVFQTGRLRLMKLFIRKALKPPALNVGRIEVADRNYMVRSVMLRILIPLK